MVPWALSGELPRTERSGRVSMVRRPHDHLCGTTPSPIGDWGSGFHKAPFGSIQALNTAARGFLSFNNARIRIPFFRERPIFTQDSP